MKSIKPLSDAPGWKKKIYEIIFEAETREGKAFDIILLWTILISVLVVFLESIQSVKAEFGNLFIILLVIRILRLLRVFRVFKLTHFLTQADVLGTALKASKEKINSIYSYSNFHSSYYRYNNLCGRRS